MSVHQVLTAGVDPGICVRGAGPSLCLRFPSHFSPPSLSHPLSLEVGPLKPAMGYGGAYSTPP